MNMRPKSEAMASIHEAIADLHSIGLVDKTTMRRFDELCLATVPEYSPDEIRALASLEEWLNPRRRKNENTYNLCLLNLTA